MGCFTFTGVMEDNTNASNQKPDTKRAKYNFHVSSKLQESDRDAPQSAHYSFKKKL